MSNTELHTSFLHLNESLHIGKISNDYESANESVGAYYPVQDENECLYEETQLERARYEEEGFYDLEIFTHYLSGFGGLSLAIIGLVLNSFCAFTLCRAAVFRAHLVFLCAVAIADALQLSCLIVIITRDIRQPDPRYLNLLPRIYIRAFLYLYPLSKFFHLAMAWLVMASTLDCWSWIKKSQVKEEWLRTRSIRRTRSFVMNKGTSSASEVTFQQESDTPDSETKANCRVIISEVLAVTAIALIALVYTIPAAWENKGDILLLGKIGTDTNCSAFIYHLMQTDLSQTALYRIGYSLLGHLVFQTGIPLVASSIAIAKISRQLQITSSTLGQLVTDAVQIVIHAGERGIVDRQQIPSPTYSQRTIVENRNIIHCSLFLSVFTFYVCHVPQLWAKIQWSLMHVESHQNSHMKYVNEFVNFMTVANAAINGFFILCFCRRYIADGARDIDMCAWCFPPKDGSMRGGICSQGDAQNSDQEDDEDDDYQDENNVDDDSVRVAGDDLAKTQGTLDNQPPPFPVNVPMPPSALRYSKNTPILGGGNVSTICDGQYTLEQPSDIYLQQTQPDYMQSVPSQPHNHRHHHRRHRHISRHNSNPQQYFDYDIDGQQSIERTTATALAPPLHFQPPQQSFPSQYFQLGPHDSDIYVAAQV